MGRRKTKQTGTELATNSINGAMSDAPVVPAPVVDIRDERISQIVRVEHSVLPKSNDEILKIFHTVDPVQFLADVIAGKAIPCHIMTDKGVITAYETPDLKMRERVAKYVVDKYMPKVAVVKHAHLHAHVDGNDKSGESDMTFAQIVARAARNSEVKNERSGQSIRVLEEEPSGSGQGLVPDNT